MRASFHVDLPDGGITAVRNNIESGGYSRPADDPGGKLLARRLPDAWAVLHQAQGKGYRNGESYPYEAWVYMGGNDRHGLRVRLEKPASAGAVTDDERRFLAAYLSDWLSALTAQQAGE